MTKFLPDMRKESLRILTVADLSPDYNSGAAGTVLNTNRALRELGHLVDEIWSTDLAPRRISHGNLHSLIEQPRQYVWAIRQAFLNKNYDAVIAQQPQAWMAARDNRRLKRDCVFLTMSQGVETRIWGVLSHFRKQYGIPSARFPHRLLTEPMQRCLARQWELSVRYSDGIIVQHTQDREYVSKVYKVGEERVHVSHSGLTPEFTQRPIRPMTPERMRRLLFVGQNVFYKGVHVLGQIVTKLLREFPDLTLTWVCNDAEHARAVLVFGVDIRDRIKMVGWTSQRDLINILDDHGIFIFPTLAEGFAKAPLEAMSRGMVVVASDCCGMRDYIENTADGFLCEPGSVEAFKDVTSRLLKSKMPPPLESRIIAKANMFSWSKTAASLAEFAAEIIRRREL